MASLRTQLAHLALIGAIVVGVCSPSSDAVAGSTTPLWHVCGTEGFAMSQGDGQHQLLCRTAYINANSGIVNDNNSRVYGSVAVVCAYSCIGGQSSCGNADGGKSGSCSTAVQTGHKSIDSSDQSDSDIWAAKQNGHSALVLKSSVVEQQAGANAIFGASTAGAAGTGLGSSSSGGASSSAKEDNSLSTLPAPCRTAAQSGNVQSRIECATATDPSIPSFVKTPQFQEDFQKITGQSLQAVINQDGGALMEKYATGALQTAYKTLDGKVDLSEFMSRAGSLVGEIMGSFPEAKRKDVANAIVPAGLQNLLPAVPGHGPSQGTALAGANGLTAPAPEAMSTIPQDRAPAQAKNGLEQKPDAETGGTLLAGLGTQPEKDYGASPENNPAISLFERVSHRYKTVSLRMLSQAPSP